MASFGFTKLSSSSAEEAIPKFFSYLDGSDTKSNIRGLNTKTADQYKYARKNIGENKNVYLDMSANGLSALINIARNKS
jgi:hypothetical protein